jgi:hypothetical protein
MASPLNVVKLNDAGAQYQITITCKCGHFRKVEPQKLAKLAGWEAKLDDVGRRFRCSRCGGREVGWHVSDLPRGSK